jgi:hypothetical protein
VRVILDLDSSATDRPTGTLIHDGKPESASFDGWLDLMRLLEPIINGGNETGLPLER